MKVFLPFVPTGKGFTISPTKSSLTESCSKADGALAVFYFVSFIVISALVMLSLFVGAVTMSMTESMETMKEEKEQAERRRRMLKAKKRVMLTTGLS